MKHGYPPSQKDFNPSTSVCTYDYVILRQQVHLFVLLICLIHLIHTSSTRSHLQIAARPPESINNTKIKWWNAFWIANNHITTERGYLIVLWPMSVNRSLDVNICFHFFFVNSILVIHHVTVYTISNNFYRYEKSKIQRTMKTWTVRLSPLTQKHS